MTTFQQLILALGLCFMGYMLWPAISAKFASMKAWLASGKVIQPASAATISVEQAQDSVLLLMRFKLQTPKPPEAALIEADIKTLAG